MARKILAWLLVLGLASPAAWPAASEDADLAKGVRQVRAGEFEAAVATLDRVARKLSKDPARSKELARAYLYLSIAYLGLNQEQKARAKFLEGLKTDREMEWEEKGLSPEVLRFLEDATKDAPAPPEEKRAARAAEKDKTKPQEEKDDDSKGFLLVGLGGAAAAVVALAASGGDGGEGPAGQTPGGDGVGGVTPNPTQQFFDWAVAGPEGPRSSFLVDDKFRVRVDGATFETAEVCYVSSCFAPPLTFRARSGQTALFEAIDTGGGYRLGIVVLYRDGVQIMRISDGISTCTIPNVPCPAEPGSNVVFFSRQIVLP